MKKFMMKFSLTLFLLTALLAATASAAPAAQLQLPNFDALADKATETVSITLDSTLLRLAAGFLDPNKPEDAAAKELISGLKGIYVKRYVFETDFAYPKADVDNVRKQLSGPGWQRLVEVRSRKEQADVDIYIAVDQNRATGLAIIASEPREFTIVNIVGSIDLEKLHQLEGQFGIPKLELEKKAESK